MVKLLAEHHSQRRLNHSFMMKIYYLGNVHTNTNATLEYGLQILDICMICVTNCKNVSELVVLE